MPALSMAQLLRAEGVRSIGYLKVRCSMRGLARATHSALLSALWLDARACMLSLRLAMPTHRRACTQLDLNGVEPGVLRSLHDACEAQPSLWPRRITYEQGNMPHSENKHALIHMFTQHGYTPALKPIEVRKPGHSLHYSHITWDMVLELK